MRRQGIKYRLVGGFSFYARAEIKDALAYARLAMNLRDDAAFARIVNTPARGIGDTTLEALAQSARQGRLTRWEALEHELAEGQLSARARRALEGFHAIVKGLVEAHGGRVEVQNRPGGGAEFTIYLPIVGSPEIAAEAAHL